jgi:hypothetical protein
MWGIVIFVIIHVYAAVAAARLPANDIDYHAYERRAPTGGADERGE